MRRRLWLLLCALGVLGTAACGAGESKANAAAKAAASDRTEAAKEPAVPTPNAKSTAENGFYEVIDNGRRSYAPAQYLSY